MSLRSKLEEIRNTAIIDTKKLTMNDIYWLCKMAELACDLLDEPKEEPQHSLEIDSYLKG